MDLCVLGLFLQLSFFLPFIPLIFLRRKKRMEGLNTDQSEINSIISKPVFVTALTRDVPLDSNGTYKLGEENLVYFETKKNGFGPLI